MANIVTPDVHQNETIFKGAVRFHGSVDLPAGQIDNADVSASAGFESSKMRHRFFARYDQPNTAATSVTHSVYTARAAGTILSFKAGSIAAAIGNSTVTVDLKKNGTTVLDSVITLDSGNVARVAEDGDLVATPTYVAGDLLEIVTVATIGTGTLPTGLFCQADLDEAAA